MLKDFAVRYLGLVYRMYSVVQRDPNFAPLLVVHFRAKKGGLEKLLAHLIMLQEQADVHNRCAHNSMHNQTKNSVDSVHFLDSYMPALDAHNLQNGPSLDQAVVRPVSRILTGFDVPAALCMKSSREKRKFLVPCFL